jgi:hypothetical protein
MGHSMPLVSQLNTNPPLSPSLAARRVGPVTPAVVAPAVVAPAVLPPVILDAERFCGGAAVTCQPLRRTRKCATNAA